MYSRRVPQQVTSQMEERKRWSGPTNLCYAFLFCLLPKFEDYLKIGLKICCGKFFVLMSLL